MRIIRHWPDPYYSGKVLVEQSTDHGPQPVVDLDVWTAARRSAAGAVPAQLSSAPVRFRRDGLDLHDSAGFRGEGRFDSAIPGTKGAK